MSSNVLQPNPPHKLSLLKHVARNTLLQPPKKSHLHHCLSKEHYFSPSYVGSFGFLLSWSEFHRENRKARNFSSLPFTLSPFLFFLVLLVSLYPLFIISCPTLSFFFIPISLCPSFSPPIILGFWLVGCCISL
ncbi:unnamed protein product [Prunus brigantina]